MSAVAHTLTEEARVSAASLRWIISLRDDLLWFMGPALLCYALLALTVTRLVPVVPLFVAWTVLVDTPHVFGTYTRTFFDRTERRERKRLLLASLLFFLIGPVLVLLGAATYFFFLVVVWSHYHQVKQHYGFSILYKIKNKDTAQLDNVLDRAFLLLSFCYPFVAFLTRDPQLMARLPASLAGKADHVTTALLAVTITAAILWFSRQVQRALLGQPLNIPKYLLLAATIPLHWVVLLTPMPYKLGTVVLILAPLHTLQYHRLIWFHNRKYSHDSQSRERYGLAALINRRLLFYVAGGVLFSLCYHLLYRYVNATGGPQEVLTQAVLAFLLGHLLIHFYLDSKIWRVRRDESVGKSLRLA